MMMRKSPEKETGNLLNKLWRRKNAEQTDLMTKHYTLGHLGGTTATIPARVVSVERAAVEWRVPECQVGGRVVLAGKSQRVTTSQSRTDAHDLGAVVMPASDQQPLHVSVVYVRQPAANDNTYAVTRVETSIPYRRCRLIHTMR